MNPPRVYTITKLMLQFKRGIVVPHAIPTKDIPRQPWMNADLLTCIERNQRRDVDGHVLRRTGGMPEAIAQFKIADALALSYFKGNNLAPAIDWHYPHNLGLLLGPISLSER